MKISGSVHLIETLFEIPGGNDGKTYLELLTDAFKDRKAVVKVLSNGGANQLVKILFKCYEGDLCLDVLIRNFGLNKLISFLSRAGMSKKVMFLMNKKDGEFYLDLVSVESVVKFKTKSLNVFLNNILSIIDGG